MHLFFISFSQEIIKHIFVIGATIGSYWNLFNIENTLISLEIMA